MKAPIYPILRAVRYHLRKIRKNSGKIFYQLVKIVPVVINSWFMLILWGQYLKIDVSTLLCFNKEIGNSLAFGVLIFFGSYYFRLCRWHRMLAVGMIIYPVLLRLSTLGIMVENVFYVGITVITTLNILAVLTIFFHGKKYKRATNKNV